jgi:aryl-alcohol dehydrogenase-like predicted oxidoreductase
MKRREFVRYGTAAAGAMAFLRWEKLLAAEAKKKHATDIVTLGKTGVSVSRLAMGTGTYGVGGRSEQSDLGVGGLADLLHTAFDHGVNFWDTADAYGTHPHVKEALKRVPREKVVILTKTHASTAEEMKADLDRFRRELGTTYIDILLLHMMTEPDWPEKKQGAMEVLSRAREEGVVRAHGVSCHSLEALTAAARSNWVQVDLARINPVGVWMDADVPTVVTLLKKMHAAGKGVIGMKIFGAGQLRDQADRCLRYVLGLDCVDAFTIGQENQHEFLDLLDRIPAAGASK